MVRRRDFLQRLLGGGALLALTGCDRLSQSERFQRLLGAGEAVNLRVQRTLVARTALAREFSEADISPRFRANGTTLPPDGDYRALLAGNFRDYRFGITGLVAHPAELSLDDLRALPSRTQITRHDCVEGWSAIAKWKGAPLSALLTQAQPLPSARFVVFHCFDTMDGSGAHYYESIDFIDAFHPQTLLAYDWNDRPLPVEYGAPLRLRVERQLGYKMAKYLRSMELVAELSHINGGHGGYWEDQGYEWYAGI